MSAAGPLAAFGLALFFAGIYYVLIGPRRFDGFVLTALGGATLSMAYELMSKSL